MQQTIDKHSKATCLQRRCKKRELVGITTFQDLAYNCSWHTVLQGCTMIQPTTPPSPDVAKVPTVESLYAGLGMTAAVAIGGVRSVMVTDSTRRSRLRATITSGKSQLAQILYF
jgi:hypothetical protein